MQILSWNWYGCWNLSLILITSLYFITIVFNIYVCDGCTKLYSITSGGP
jgi:hypothetical protein